MIKPVMLYKAPGPHLLDGSMVDYRVVEFDDAEKSISDGWSYTIHDAIAKQCEDENTPPSREEMEEKAKEMGLKFDGRTSNAKLRQMIENLVKD